MSELSPLDEANIASVKAQESFAQAQAVRQLVDGGFSHESAVKAVAAGDLTLAEKA
jgi:uncharacterized UBP type Zn finger protein